MSKNLVIVESPAKAKTIEKYLGPDFRVLASVGHIRKDTKVDKTTFDVTYEIDEDHKKIITELKKATKSATKIWLATDEDREGESISWHLLEVLKLPKNTARITFHEITKSALETAIAKPRTVDMAMVASQQARQTLDMLVGYDLSGVVRKKVPGAISAGRVQSPALRLLVEREKAIEKFESKFSFKIDGKFKKSAEFHAVFDGELPESETAAQKLLEKLSTATFVVDSVEKTEGTRANPVPLTTAALQIEANSKLGFSSRTTMSAAQGLYQSGLITYHRTDSLNLSTAATAQMAKYIEKTFGKNYLKPRHFKTRSASAQEAHEAIRPTDITKTLAGKNDYEKRLYHLIWSRTLATQMANAKVDKTVVKITTKDESFTAKGEIITFDGFLKVYGKSKDLELPELKTGDHVDYLEITARQTFTKPPARYTEGSLVKKLEELGIGRPSTYASIMTAIQARGYCLKGDSEGEDREIVELKLVKQVTKSKTSSLTQPTQTDQLSSKDYHNEQNEISAKKHLPNAIERTVVSEKFGSTKGKLVPTPIGELVSGFLLDNFKNIVDYKFTAHIEKDLDLIADKKLDRVKMLKDFYGPFRDTVLISEGVERYNNAHLLGHDPKTGKPIFAKIGKNGGFIQLGDNEKTAGEKPRFAPLPKRKSVKTVSLEQALKQLALPALPRTLGTAKDGTELIAMNGPFGPYLKAGKYNIPIKDFDPYTVSLDEVLPLYTQKIDSIIADWGDIMIIQGVYGPYIKGPGRRNNVKIDKDKDPKKITKAEAEKLLATKPKKSSRRKSTRTTKAKTKKATNSEKSSKS